MSLLGRVDKLLQILDNFETSKGANVTQLLKNESQKDKPKSTSSHVNEPSEYKEFSPNNDLSQQIIDELNKLGIKYTSRAHKIVMTSAEHKEVAGMKGILVKNLLLKTKRHNTQWLIVYDAKKPDIDLKLLGNHLGVGGGLRFADPTKLLNMSKGCITPLAVLFDKEKGVKVFLDKDIMNGNEPILVHPGTNSGTVGIKPDDLMNYLKLHSNEPEILDLSTFLGHEEEQKPSKPKSTPTEKQEHNKQEHNKKEHKKEHTSKKQKDTTKKNDSVEKKAKEHGSEHEGITFDKYTQFGDWYAQLVTKTELIDRTDISGCFVLRPLAYFIWDQIKEYMDGEMKKMGVSNTYFPLFVSEDALQRESTHFKDFNPEVAWVTHSGEKKLEKKIAVRPTSETIMYPLFHKWIRSFRDLPLRINQWCNVVRWEFKDPTPFLRTREFLWQEGHTAHPNYESAKEEVYAVLDMYARTYEHVCSIPTIKGIKTKKETFPGADFSTTVEGYIPGSGRGIQGATSHCLGQHFSEKKMFDISFLDENNKEQIVVQNSWGFTTRSIGVMVMNHSDNHGLVLPPRVAQRQVVIIPIPIKITPEEHKNMKDISHKLCDQLNKYGIRTFIDDRDSKNPGFKFNEWELKGVPIRLELGPTDIKNQQIQAARRDIRDDKDKLVKITLSWDNIEKSIEQLLNDIQINLLNKAKKILHDNVIQVTKWDDFLNQINQGKLVLAPHCNELEWEEKIGDKTKEYFENLPDTTGSGQTGKAKALCIPLEQPKLESDTKCIISGKPATCWILFGRSY